MLATPHTIVGLAIGSAIQNPIVAVPAAFLSHYICDVVPHWDIYKTYPPEPGDDAKWKPAAIFFDIILGVAVGLSMTLYALWVKDDPTTAVRLFLCGIAGAAPDALYVPLLFWGSKNKIFVINHNIQKMLHIQANPLIGNLFQWGVAIGAFLMTLNLLKQ